MNDCPVLQYTPPSRARLRVHWWLGIFWLGVSGVIWRHTDWSAYVDEGGGTKPWPKLEMPLWSQLSASLVLGLAATGALFGLLIVVRRFGRGT